MIWHMLGEWTQVSTDENRMAGELCAVLDSGNAEILNATFKQGKCAADTTVMVVERPYERLLFVRRQDGSMVLATDRPDWQDDLEEAEAWS